MRHDRRGILALGLGGALALAGCGVTWETAYQDVIDPEISRTWRVSTIDVQVPQTLSVSEANTYAPQADIVWRGEPVGNRYEQVDRIVTEAAEAGASGLKGSRPVRLVIVLHTFHALTEKTRYGLESAGVHNITFTAQVFDDRTGEPLSPADRINADLVGFTGTEALEAEAQGQTQRVRIVAHLTRVFAGWLGAGPDDVRGAFTRSGR